MATSASSSTSRTRGLFLRLRSTTALLPPFVIKDGLKTRDLVSSVRGMANRQRKPALFQSNAALPPNCCSILAAITLRPQLRDEGSATGGPPFSTQCSVSASASSSHSRLIFPLGDDKAPCLAALVASSCSASASPCAVAGCSEMSGPPHWILSPVRYGANSSPTRVPRSAPRQRESERSVCARANALMRPSIACTYSSTLFARVSLMME